MSLWGFLENCWHIFRSPKSNINETHRTGDLSKTYFKPFRPKVASSSMRYIGTASGFFSFRRKTSSSNLHTNSRMCALHLCAHRVDVDRDCVCERSEMYTVLSFSRAHACVITTTRHRAWPSSFGCVRSLFACILYLHLQAASSKSVSDNVTSWPKVNFSRGCREQSGCTKWWCNFRTF